jgi:coenzyme PQQ precursor peptide PqqA
MFRVRAPKSLIERRFVRKWGNSRKFFCIATRTRCLIFNWRTFRTALLYARGRESRPFEKELEMSWKTPKIVEVPVGMEINMYACAARK